MDTLMDLFRDLQVVCAELQLGATPVHAKPTGKPELESVLVLRVDEPTVYRVRMERTYLREPVRVEVSYDGMQTWDELVRVETVRAAIYYIAEDITDCRISQVLMEIDDRGRPVVVPVATEHDGCGSS